MGKTWRGRGKKFSKHNKHGGDNERGGYEESWNGRGHRRHDTPRHNVRISDIRDYDAASDGNYY